MTALSLQRMAKQSKRKKKNVKKGKNNNLQYTTQSKIECLLILTFYIYSDREMQQFTIVTFTFFNFALLGVCLFNLDRLPLHRTQFAISRHRLHSSSIPLELLTPSHNNLYLVFLPNPEPSRNFQIPSCLLGHW